MQQKTGTGASGWSAAIMALWLAACVGFALWRIAPPVPVSESAPPTVFSATRALHALSEIARAPHPTGSAENDKVRDYLLGQFRAMGVEATVQTATASTGGGRVYTVARVKNIIAHLPGANPDAPAVLLAAHYDSVPTGPGASDDGVGVAALLETARAIKASPPLRNDVYILLTDGEEMGLLGARAFVDENPVAKRIGVVLNFEARGVSGPVFMFETSDGNLKGRGAGNAGVVSIFAHAAPGPYATSLMYALYKRLPNDTDLTVFRQGGLPGLNFANVDGWNHYHTELDNPQEASPAVLQQHGEFALSLAKAYASTDLNWLKDHGGGDAVYFDVLGYFLIRYPQFWVIPFTILAGLFWLGIVVLGFKSKQLTIAGTIMGLLAPPLCLLVVGAGAARLWLLIKALYPDLARVPWGDPYNRPLFEAGFACLTLAIVLGVYGLLSIRWSGRDLGVGATFWWLALLIAATVYLPGATYAFLLPLACAFFSVFGYFGAGERLHPARVFFLLLFAVPTLAVWVILIRGLWMLLSFNQPIVAPAAITLVAALLTPQLVVVLAPRRWLPPVLLLLAGIGFLVYGGLTVRSDARHRLTDTLFYAQGTGAGKAVWATAEKNPDPWVAGYVANNRRTIAGNVLLPGVASTHIAGDAPDLALPTPHIVKESDTQNGDGRTVRLRITVPRPDAVLGLSTAPNGFKLRTAAVEGKDVPLYDGGQLRLQYLSVPPSGIALTLTFEAKSPALTLWADSIQVGLPELPGTGRPRRPDNLMPSPVRDRLTTDVAIARTEYPLSAGP